MPGTAKTYRLCGFCSEREGAEAEWAETVPGPECSICSGLLDGAEKMGSLAVKKIRPYQFRTFAVGVSLPGRVQEREDELRSDLKIKGRETIKIQAARLVAAFMARSTRKRVDRRKPDVTILADFGAGDASVSSKPVFYYGRYTKPAGVAQRRSYCEQCRGAGCEKCRGTGYERKASVEEALRRKFEGLTGSSKVVFTWLGSEDRDSRVFPPGRPFVAEVKNPRKRKLPRRFGARTRSGMVAVTAGRMLPSKPTRFPSFRFLTDIRAVATSKVDPRSLRGLKTAFREASVTFQRPNNRPTVKTVHSVSAAARGRTLLIRAELDGGLPVKRFVNGDLVYPSVSEVLKTEVGCRSFDIRRVREIGEFEFAEIARSEEKN